MEYFITRQMQSLEIFMFAAVCALTPHVISPRNVSRCHPVLNDILHTDRNDRCDCNVMFCNEIISIINLSQSCKLILTNKKIKCDYNMFINLIMIIIGSIFFLSISSTSPGIPVTYANTLCNYIYP